MKCIGNEVIGNGDAEEIHDKGREKWSIPHHGNFVRPPCSVKLLVIIPKHHHITKPIITHYHEKVKHQCKGLTINEIRSNGE